MESTLNNPTLIAAGPKSKSVTMSCWSVIGRLCLWIAITAYASRAAGGRSVQQLGFPSASFRVELSWAKILGIALLLFPVPARVKE
jgi:hypothetical protein